MSNELALPSRLVEKFKVAVSIYDEASIIVGGIEDVFGYNRQTLASLKAAIATAPTPSNRNKLTISDSGNNCSTKLNRIENIGVIV